MVQNEITCCSPYADVKSDDLKISFYLKKFSIFWHESYFSYEIFYPVKPQIFILQSYFDYFWEPHLSPITLKLVRDFDDRRILNQLQRPCILFSVLNTSE